MNRNFVLIGIALFIWGIGESMFFIFQPIYLQQWGASPELIGVILGASGIIAAAALVPAGFISDKLGPRPAIWTSWLIALAATWLMALANSLPVFAAGLLMYGLTAFVSAPLNMYASANRGKFSVGRAITLISAAFNLGAMLGPILGGMIGEWMGIKSIYAIASGIFVVSTLVVLQIKPITPVPHTSQEPRRNLFHNRLFVSLLGIALLTTFATYLPQPLAANFLQNERGLSLAAVGQLGSASGLGNAMVNILLGNLSPSLAVILGQMMVAVFSLLLWQGNHMVWYCLGYFFMGGFRLSRSMFMAFSRPLIHENEIGLAFGMLETANSLAIIAAPTAAGFLYAQNPSSMFFVSLGLIAVMLIVNILVLPRLQKHAPLENDFIPIKEENQ